MNMETTSKLETVTPSQARKYLEKMIANRPLSEGKALEYAIAMDEGKWIINGETIKFDDEGRLFDGQHRLQACALSEKSFKTYIVRGVSDKLAFSTVDVGKMRTHGDIFDIAGYKNSNNSSAAGMLIYFMKNHLITVNGVRQRRFTKEMSSPVVQKMKQLPVRASNITKEDLLEFCAPFKSRLIEAVSFASAVKRNKLMPTSMIAGCYFMFAEKMEFDAKTFFVDLFEGAGLSPVDAVYHLRERLIGNQAAAQKLTRWQTVFLVCKAWNKRRAGEKVKYLKITDEEFPKLL